MKQEPKEKTGIVRDSQGKFVKGHSGHPEGMPAFTEERKMKRKVERDLKAEFTRKMEESLGISGTTLTTEAKKGNIVACKEINNRALGMPKQTHEVGGIDGEAIPIELTVSKAIEKIYGEDNEKL